MALKRCLLSTIVIAISIGVSPILTWKPDVHRYESYDLEKGPVFYEAYYPDTNEEPRTNYQEKRYFDRGPVIEKTYQLPSERLVYPENNVQLPSYQTKPIDETFLRSDDRFPVEEDEEPLDIKEISKLARRAISRDLENWNTLEDYLDRAKYQDPVYHRRVVVQQPGYRMEQPGLQDSAKQHPRSDPRRDLYEEVRNEPLALPSRLRPNDQQDSIRRLSARDLAGRDPAGSFSSIRYEDRPSRELEAMQVARADRMNALPLKNDVDRSDPRAIVDPYPTENIFAPRPQVINYVFSKRPEATTDGRVQSTADTREASESVPRNYGDNLIRDEVKRTEGDKDVKVTSIEVSEVPRHKTRHHHGEWPKRDYSHRHQS